MSITAFPFRSPWRDHARAIAAEVAARPSPPPSPEELRLARIDAICSNMERLLDEARGLLDQVRAR